MKLYKLIKDVYEYILSTNPSGEMLIASYGIYCGLNACGADRYNDTAKFLSDIQKFNVKIKAIVGIFYPQPCPNCGSTRARDNYIKRLNRHLVEYSNILDIRFVPLSHLKFILWNDDNVMMGGMNYLSSSDWHDISIYIKDKELYNHLKESFINLWGYNVD